MIGPARFHPAQTPTHPPAQLGSRSLPACLQLAKMDTAFVPQIKLASQDKSRRRAPIVSAAQPICQV